MRIVSDRTPETRIADRISRLMYEIGGWLSIGFGLAGVVAMLAQAGTTGAAFSAAMGLFFAFFLLLGIAVTPSVRGRLADRHAITRFGRVPVVERRAVGPDDRCDRDCVVCGAEIDRGVVRRYRRDTVVAGVPLRRGAHGYNAYCLGCRRPEVTMGSKETADHEASASSDPVPGVERRRSHRRGEAKQANENGAERDSAVSTGESR